MKELTYFNRHTRVVGTDYPRIVYDLKIEYMRPIQRDIERYWRASITGGRFLVNMSDDHPTLPIEALRELVQIYNDWIEISGEIPLPPQPPQDPSYFIHQG